MSLALRGLTLLALLATACGAPSPSFTLDAKDTLADGRKVLRLGDHPVARLARYGYAFDRDALSCTRHVRGRALIGAQRHASVARRGTPPGRSFPNAP